MNMIPVVSDNVREVGYEARTHMLRVRFRSGGLYDYYGVNVALYEQFMFPHPWRRVGRLVKGHGFRRVAA